MTKMLKTLSSLSSSNKMATEELLSQDYAIALVLKARPKKQPTNIQMPTIRQCVGTNRLWGAMLGKALYDDLEGTIPLHHLVDIAILSRSILVLEDYVDDEFIDDKEFHFVVKWIKKIEMILFQVFETIGEKISVHKELKLRSRCEVKKRSKGDLSSGVYKSSIEKCLIFFNPYRLKIAEKTNQISKRIKFLEYFFFVCQLLDDFQDLAEDREKKMNNNIFFVDYTPEESDLVEKTRLYWVVPLLEQICLNLNCSDIKAGAVDSPVLYSYYMDALEYLNEMLKACKRRVVIYPNQSHSIESFETWKFSSLDMIGKFSLIPEYEKYIRPEIMQTYVKGIRDIKYV